MGLRWSKIVDCKAKVCSTIDCNNYYGVSMAKKHSFFDDLGKLFESAMSNAANLKNETSVAMRKKFDDIIGRMDIVTHEEFGAMKKMLEKVHKELEAVKKHLKLPASPLDASVMKKATKKVAKTAKPAVKKAQSIVKKAEKVVKKVASKTNGEK